MKLDSQIASFRRKSAIYHAQLKSERAQAERRLLLLDIAIFAHQMNQVADDAELAERRAKSAHELRNAFGQVFVGERSEYEANFIGTAGSVFFGLTGLDAYKDVADMHHLYQNWEGTWSDYGSLGINALALAPVLGAFKPVVRGASTVKAGANAAESVVDAAKPLEKLSEVAPNNAAKIVDAGLPGSFTARELGNAITSSPGAARAYQRLQDMGMDLRIVNRADGLAGQTNGLTNGGFVTINRHYNANVGEALETLVHESKHVDLLRTTGNVYGNRGIHKGEYAARAREFFFKHGRRPDALDRAFIRREIIDAGY